MDRFLKILYTIVSLFLLLFLESFFVELLGFNIIFLVLLFAYKRIDWKQLLFTRTVLSIAMDVSMHYKLGTNLLLFIVPLGIFILFSMFSSVEEGIGSYVVRFFSIFLYYLLNILLPSLLLSGTFGYIDGKLILLSLIKSVISILLLVGVNFLTGGLRERGNAWQIRLK